MRVIGEVLKKLYAYSVVASDSTSRPKLFLTTLPLTSLTSPASSLRAFTASCTAGTATKSSRIASTGPVLDS